MAGGFASQWPEGLIRSVEPPIGRDSFRQTFEPSKPSDPLCSGAHSVHRRIALSAVRRVDPARPARHGVLLNVLPDNGLTVCGVLGLVAAVIVGRISPPRVWRAHGIA